MKELSMRKTFQQMKLKRGGFQAAPEYSLIENSFQFQNAVGVDITGPRVASAGS
jgi:hypothetical protein